MPIHNWRLVDAGIFHAMHHRWISAISDALNAGLLPESYYALPEQHAAGLGPDVLTLQGSNDDLDETIDVAKEESATSSTTLLVEKPKIALTAETDLEFYRRKQSTLVVRHVSGDRVVAMIEIVSPGNKSSRHAIRSFVEKVGDMLDRRVHLLIVDILSPGRRDPQGIHGVIWDEVAGEEYDAPADKPLTLAAYESALTIRAYVRHFAVGDSLIDMPLFLEPDGCIQAPLESTYATAVASIPKRWRRVLEG